MENIFGIILFILFIALRSMSDRKKGMNRGPKAKPPITAAKPITAPAKPKTKPVNQAEPLGQSKVRPGKTKPAAPDTPPFIPAPVPAVGESYYDKMPVMEGSPPTRAEAEQKRKPAAVSGEVSTAQVLNYEDLRRAVLWSEILAKPRAMRRAIR